MTKPESLQSAGSRPRRQWVGLLVVWVMGVGLLHLGVLAIRLKVEDIFRDFKVSLPSVTIWLLQFARLYREPASARRMLWISIGVLITVGIVGQALKPKAYRLAMLLSALFWFVLLTAMAAAMLLPIISLLRAVSGGK